MAEILYYAFPYFILLLVVEYLAFRHLESDGMIGYDLRDSRTSIAMGMGNVIINVGWKFAVLALYALLYELAPWHLPTDAWWVWVALSAKLAGLDDLNARTAVYDVFWDTIITASGNLAYRLALNTLVAGQKLLSFGASVVGAEVGDAPAVAALAHAVDQGREDDAFTAARALLVRSIPDSRE